MQRKILKKMIVFSGNKMREMLRIVHPLYFTRPMIKFVKQNCKKEDLVGVEIGVSTGFNAKTILMNLPIKKLYLVDPYEPYVEDGGKFIFTHNFSVTNEMKAQKMLSKFKEKIVFVKRKSKDAVRYIPNDLDFVYIDGNHAYKFVKQDITFYYKKLRKGGVIGGHDFYGSFLGVCKAAMEFANMNNLKLHTDNIDWWLVKR
jgi:hypothetical protein